MTGHTSEWEISCCTWSVRSEMRTNTSPLCFPSSRKLLWAASNSPSHYFLFLIKSIWFLEKKGKVPANTGLSGEKTKPWPPMAGATCPNSSRCRAGRWRRSETFTTTYFLKAPSLHNSPSHFQPRDISPRCHLLCAPFKVFWSETIFPIFLSSVCIKVRTLLGILAIGICYLFFSGAKEEAAVWLKKALIQPAIASLCFPVTLSTSIRTQWKWYRSKALLPPPRTKSVP